MGMEKQIKAVVAPMIVLVLVLVLSAAISGQSQGLLTKQEIVTTMEEGLELSHGVTAYTSANETVFVSIHSGSSPGLSPKAGIYLQRGDKFRLLKQIQIQGYFLRPNFFRVQLGDSHENTLFLQITQCRMGTGNERTEHIYYIHPDGGISPVDFIPAPVSFSPYLKISESIQKGENNIFTPKGLFFEFSIWNPGDPTCCPTAGRVTGTYLLRVLDSGKKQFQISMDRFDRHLP